MATFSIEQAKERWPRLVARACRGEEIIITRWKRPVVKLVALPKPMSKQKTRG
jgi:antitoxin (DNA-binding transcriptional repressor) of toxin-antitoxin stability system